MKESVIFYKKIILDDEKVENIVIERLNNRRLLLTFRGECREGSEWGGLVNYTYIDTLTFYNKKKQFFKIALGDSIGLQYECNKEIKEALFTINHITRESNDSYLLYESVLNKSAEFLFPLLNIDRSLYSTNLFVNSYLSTNREKSKPIYQLHLLYRCFNLEDLEELDSILSSNNKYISSIVTNDKILYSFRITSTIDPSNFYLSGFMDSKGIIAKEINIYDKFLEGRYSEFPEEYKKTLLKFHKVTRETPYLKYVLYKEEIYRKKLEKEFGVPLNNQELLDIVDLNKETYEFK